MLRLDKHSFNHDIRISPKNWPFVTHFHGGEIRPVFDGIPLSWVWIFRYRKDGGIGSFSLEDNCYFSSFDNIDHRQVNYNLPNLCLPNAITGIKIKNFRIARYTNQQNIGSFWYHDHD